MQNEYTVSNLQHEIEMLTKAKHLIIENTIQCEMTIKTNNKTLKRIDEKLDFYEKRKNSLLEAK